MSGSNVPRDFDALKSVLVQRRTELPKRLAQVADFAVAEPDEIAFGTVASVATLAQVQPSTLVRFAQALGYAGFSDLQTVFRSRLRDRWPDYQERLKALRGEVGSRGGPMDLLNGFAETSVNSVLRLCETVSQDALERAVETLAKARTIYLLGFRRSFPVSAYLAYAFGQLGIHAVIVDNTGDMAPEQIGRAGPEDAVLAISFMTYSPTTLALTAQAYDHGVPVVSITDSAFSPLVPNSSHWIEVAEADFGAFRSLSATLCVAMTLAVAIGERRGATAV